ncbi:hypothetical protein BDU57DRAFT_163180 [Ampelomyces quisqualis]|uniref:Major facilitator superfamily (MFS) profile domain-containing protein n=1 Tax=Ampelomyces quisqualis TaxID=50730 RepID=A0A6A5QTV7_AMPQU|nr:hypothetical protein BDU57DRAFT_163180 [Ampelomyces quisqualis]
MITIVVSGIGVWPVSFAASAETSSLPLRAKIQGIGWFVSALCSTVLGLSLPYVSNPDESAIEQVTPGHRQHGFANKSTQGALWNSFNRSRTDVPRAPRIELMWYIATLRITSRGKKVSWR